jgi:hypothetical protein
LSTNEGISANLICPVFHFFLRRVEDFLLGRIGSIVFGRIGSIVFGRIGSFLFGRIGAFPFPAMSEHSLLLIFFYKVFFTNFMIIFHIHNKCGLSARLQKFAVWLSGSINHVKRNPQTFENDLS